MSLLLMPDDEPVDDLSKQIHITDWQYLAAAHARGSLIWVTPDMDLLTVGTAVVSDDKAAVEGWLAAQQIGSCPDRLAIAQLPLRTFIAAPYVLVQELTEQERAAYNQEKSDQ